MRWVGDLYEVASKTIRHLNAALERKGTSFEGRLGIRFEEEGLISFIHARRSHEGGVS